MPFPTLSSLVVASLAISTVALPPIPLKNTWDASETALADALDAWLWPLVDSGKCPLRERSNNPLPSFLAERPLEAIARASTPPQVLYLAWQTDNAVKTAIREAGQRAVRDLEATSALPDCIAAEILTQFMEEGAEHARTTISWRINVENTTNPFTVGLEWAEQGPQPPIKSPDLESMEKGVDTSWDLCSPRRTAPPPRSRVGALLSSTIKPGVAPTSWIPPPLPSLLAAWQFDMQTRAQVADRNARVLKFHNQRYRSGVTMPEKKHQQTTLTLVSEDGLSCLQHELDWLFADAVQYAKDFVTAFPKVASLTMYAAATAAVRFAPADANPFMPAPASQEKQDKLFTNDDQLITARRRFDEAVRRLKGAMRVSPWDAKKEKVEVGKAAAAVRSRMKELEALKMQRWEGSD
ncbi:hypothetical protein HK104_005953 [Borealophlyctis nickersoniae]|nr:hypothetical protein HK104_005953 [Borealophlyctis nickersoniae]